MDGNSSSIATKLPAAYCLVDSTIWVMGKIWACEDAGESSRPKSGAAVPLCMGEVSPHLTQCRLGRVVPPYQMVS